MEADREGKLRSAREPRAAVQSGQREKRLFLRIKKRKKEIKINKKLFEIKIIPIEDIERRFRRSFRDLHGSAAQPAVTLPAAPGRSISYSFFFFVFISLSFQFSSFPGFEETAEVF